MTSSNSKIMQELCDELAKYKKGWVLLDSNDIELLKKENDVKTATGVWSSKFCAMCGSKATAPNTQLERDDLSGYMFCNGGQCKQEFNKFACMPVVNDISPKVKTVKYKHPYIVEKFPKLESRHRQLYCLPATKATTACCTVCDKGGNVGIHTRILKKYRYNMFCILNDCIDRFLDTWRELDQYKTEVCNYIYKC